MEAGRVQLPLMFLFVAWLALISLPADCVLDMCPRCYSEKKKVPPHDLLRKNEAISWLRLEKLLRPLAGAHSEKV